MNMNRITNKATESTVKGRQSIIVPDGYRGIFVLLGVTLLMLWLKSYYLAGLHLFLAGFVAFFFRNPQRVVPDMPGAVVSPADGKVIGISQTEMPGFTEPLVKVSIFLSIFNVHINRSPLAGRVEAVDYSPGKFKAAFADKASSDNEHNTILLAGEQARVMVKQIAGLIARRVVCWIKPGEQVARGERIGLIRFGSRVELFLPAKITQLKVNEGDVVKGGETIIALINAPGAEEKRVGVLPNG
jgi:phosphatidylserine decarboxylase